MPYIAIASTALETLERALAELSRSRRALDRASAQVGELGQDLCDDAVARLRERGASAAQIASYEQGWALRRGALVERVEEVRAAEHAIEAALAQVKRGDLEGEVLN